jgi:uncharacterized NAD(P)/FAD-binding protein YdhS
MKRKRVAIVGAGFSGAVLAANLLRRGGVDVTLIERSGDYGRGVAYATKDMAHLLNVRASNMSAYADKPDHFVRWLGERGDGATFAPRALYGRYVQSVLRDAARGRWFGALKRVQGNVVACRQSESGWTLSLATGAALHADAVVLALGNGESDPPKPFAEAGVPMISAWDGEAQRRIPSSADVLIVGAGLTMIDVVLSLSKRQRRGKIIALSRRGLTPRAQPKDLMRSVPQSLDLPPSLSLALHTFRREAKALAERGESWRLVFDGIRARTPELWMALPDVAQRRFLRHLRPYWDVHRHRAAPDVAARITELRANGHLEIVAGTVVLARKTRKGATVMYRPRGDLKTKALDVACIINCTGASLDFARSHDLLVRQLIDEGVARGHTNGVGFDVTADNRLRRRSGLPQASLFAIGPITQGAFWESTAVPELRLRAAQIAEALSPQG